MPLYDYRCDTCEGKFEARSRLERAADIIFCPSCGGTARRLYSSFSIKVHPSYNEAQEIVHEKYERGEIA